MEEEKIKPSPLTKKSWKAAYNKASKPLLWVGIISIVMLFAGLTSAYVVRADNGNWLIFDLPNAFYLSTAVIVTSSITLFFACKWQKRTIKWERFRDSSYVYFGLTFYLFPVCRLWRINESAYLFCR